ncbi:MAG: hypothetical protein IT323_01860 [Anaerolineae bacterium]|nr:hypothetical protein [Anaerolineae bacterium]
MSLTRRFYDILAEILHETQDLGAGASLLQTDRVMAERFAISESTARNWRRGKSGQIAPATARAIIARCRELAPQRVSDLQFIDQLSRGAHEVKLAAETLVNQLESHVLSNGASWHIYSGPLKIAFDTSIDAIRRRQLLSRSSMIVERIFEIGIDKSDIPCLSELIRYSMHGWYVDGFYATRIASLSNRTSGIYDGYLGAVEEALYLGDGCAVPCMISGDVEQAHRYTQNALEILDAATPTDERQSAISIRDAQIMIRAIQAMIACHRAGPEDVEQVARFAREFENSTADVGWIEGTRHEALGYAALVMRVSYPNAAHHFEQAGAHLDRWLAQFDIPFSSTSSQSLGGYARLLIDGPTPQVKSEISDGLLRTIDLGTVSHEIRARLCQSRFYERSEDGKLAAFHRNRAQELVERHHLQRWYTMVNRILTP